MRDNVSGCIAKENNNKGDDKDRKDIRSIFYINSKVNVVVISHMLWILF